jgi:hypothetical protein
MCSCTMVPTSITCWSKTAGAGGTGNMRLGIWFWRNWNVEHGLQGKGSGLIHHRFRPGSIESRDVGDRSTSQIWCRKARWKGPPIYLARQPSVPGNLRDIYLLSWAVQYPGSFHDAKCKVYAVFGRRETLVQKEMVLARRSSECKPLRICISPSPASTATRREQTRLLEDSPALLFLVGLGSCAAIGPKNGQ